LKNFLIIALILFGVGFSTDYSAQTGGKKRERRTHKKISFKRKKSAGNADAFAHNGGKKSIFKRLFKKEKKPFTAENKKTDKRVFGDNRSIYRIHRSEGKQNNASLQSKKNAERSKKRVRGNKTFSKKKY